MEEDRLGREKAEAMEQSRDSKVDHIAASFQQMKTGGMFAKKAV